MSWQPNSGGTSPGRPLPADVLVNCFRSVLALGPPGELATAAYLVSGRIAPDYEPGAELNVRV